MRMHWLLLVVLLGMMVGGCGGTKDESAQDRTVSWEEAIEILNSGEVVGAYQLHSLEVTLELRDGSMITTQEPNIDDIFREVERCGSACQGIVLATE
jgi:hypothetical protein